MENSNKRKINSCVVGAVLILFITVLAGCSKSDADNAEVANANTEETSDQEELITEELNTEEPAKENIDTETSNIEEDSNTEESDTENTDTETSNEEESDTEDSETEEPETEEADTEESNAETSEPTANGSITTVSNWGTPQEYNGDPEGKGPGRIIVKGFDYNDFFNGLSWRGEYWTASNGVEIKIVSVDGRNTGMMPVPDGKGKDNEPTSPFQVAMAEAYGANINKYAADLNITIPLATYKRTDIDINDANLVAYRDAYDYKLFANHGMAAYYEPYKYGDQINLRFAVASDGIGEFDSVGAQFWRVRRVNDYWEVRINGNLAEFRWDGIHQVLRYLSPDGDSLYQVIYEDWYFGSPVILEYDEWFAVGNSQIYQKDTTDLGYGIYYFK